MFFEDALEVSRLLDIRLTKRQEPMCGVPIMPRRCILPPDPRGPEGCDLRPGGGSGRQGHHPPEVWYRDARGRGGRRRVLDANRNNYLAGVYARDGVFGLAALGFVHRRRFYAEKAANRAGVEETLARLAASRCVAPADMLEPGGALEWLRQTRPEILTPQDDWTFDPASAGDLLTRHFGVQSLDGFGCASCPGPGRRGRRGAVLC